MVFRFKLEAVLRYRQSLEDRERVRLETLLAQRTTLLRELDQVRTINTRLRSALEEGMEKASLPAVEILFSAARQEAGNVEQQLLQHRLLELQSAVSQQTERFRSEKRQREILQSLREGQLQVFQREQQRREQARLDELYLLRRRYHKS